MTDIITRLRNPPFGTDTSERNLMSAAAEALAAKDAEIALLRKVIKDNWEGSYWRGVTHSQAKEIRAAIAGGSDA